VLLGIFEQEMLLFLEILFVSADLEVADDLHKLVRMKSKNTGFVDSFYQNWKNNTMYPYLGSIKTKEVRIHAAGRRTSRVGEMTAPAA
jgi:hypothetical protein